MTIEKPLFAVLLLVMPATAQDETNPADIKVQVEPLLQGLRNSIAQERWLDAVQSFDTAWQQLHDSEDQSPRVRFAGTRTLRPGQHHPLAGARAQLREAYRSAPSVFREEYQRQYNGPARRRLLEALQHGNRQSLLALVRRYENCKSAATVLGHLVTDSMARGNLLNAALMLRQLNSRTTNPSLEMQLMLANLWLRAGFEQESQQTVRRLTEHSGYGSSIPYGARELRLPDSPAAVAGWLADELSCEIPDPPTWLQPQGCASRTKLQDQQSAHMAKAWQYSVFYSRAHPELNDKLQHLEQRVLSAVYDVPISPTLPVVTNNLVIFQGIGNLRAVSRFSGKPVWESSRFNRQLHAALRWTSAPNQQLEATRTLDRIVHDANRNYVRGQLASDGQLIFCVEETSQGPIPPLSEAPSNLQVQNFNVLRVYDVATGRLLGQAGGLAAPAKSGQTEPLAATCFLGAPLLLQDRILTLVEDSHGIHLLDLRLRPGPPGTDSEMQFEVKDRQLLSVPLYQLPEHPLRRYCGVTPSFSDGLIICHGCDEQVLGLAADDLSIEWVYRYRASVGPKEIGGGDPVFGGATTQEDSIQRDTRLRPHDSLVRITESLVLLMPRDSDQIVCLSLYTGKEKWSRPRGELRYVAALTDSVVVLAGATRLIAMRLSSGSIIWQQEFTEAEISAQPAATDRLIYLPTRQGHVLIVGLADGRRLLDRQFSDSAIGNLLSVPGQLIAQSSTSVTSWKPAKTSGDSLLTAIEESLLYSHPDAVILRLVNLAKTATDKTQKLARQLLIEQLLESVRLDYQRNLHHVPLLKQMIGADAPTAVQVADAIRAALGLTIHDMAMFAEHWNAVRAADIYKNRLDQLVVQGLTTQPDLTADEFAAQASEVIQTALTRRQRLLRAGRVRLLATNQIAATVQTALTQLEGPSQQRAVALLRPMVQAILSEKSDSLLFPDPLYFCWMAGLAECLLPLNEAALNRVPASTQQALVPQLLASRTAGWQNTHRSHASLNKFWNQAETVSLEAWPELDVESRGPGNDALGRIADLLYRQLPEARLRKPPQVTAGAAHTEKRPRTWTQGAPKTLIPLQGTPGVYRGWQFARLHNQPGILAIDGEGDRRWVFNPHENSAVQGHASNLRSQQTDYAVACGRLLVLSDNGRLYMLNAAEGSPQVLWSVSLNDVLPEATNHQKFGRGWERTTVYGRQPDGLAPIGPLTEYGLPLFRGRRLVVLNPWTGRHMWTQDGLPDDSRMAASDDQLCLISESTSQIQVRNLRDGSVQQSGQLPDWWAEGNSLYETSVRHISLEAGIRYPWRIVVEGTRCLIFTLQPDQAALTSYDLSSVDSLGPAVAWHTILPSNSVFSNVCEGLIATLSDNNQLQIRHVSDGTLISDQTVQPITNCEQLYLRRSQNRLLVLTYAPNATTEPLVVNDAVPLNGPIYALDTRDGSIAWTGRTSDESLRILNASNSPTLPPAPMLILLRRIPRKTPGRLGSDYATRIVDVDSGNVLHEDNNVGVSLSFHALRFDGDRKFTVNFDRRAIKFDFSGGNATLENKLP